MQLEVLQARECGGCTECCTALGVADLNKKNYEPCRFSRSGVGCAIYNSRPFGCRHFECLWKKGNFSENERPDKTGIIFARQYQPATKRLTTTVYLRDSNWRRDEAKRRMLEELMARETLVVITPDEHSILVPFDQIDDVADNIDEYMSVHRRRPLPDAAKIAS